MNISLRHMDAKPAIKDDDEYAKKCDKSLAVLART
jgi:hypothetical protein